MVVTAVYNDPKHVRVMIASKMMIRQLVILSVNSFLTRAKKALRFSFVFSLLSVIAVGLSFCNRLDRFMLFTPFKVTVIDFIKPEVFVAYLKQCTAGINHRLTDLRRDIPAAVYFDI